MRSGQALVVVLLTLAVALTLGLSVVTRTNTDVRVSTNQEESQRAFSAAESGLEEALGAGKTTAGTVGSGVGQADYTISITGVPVSKEFNFPELVKSGESVSMTGVNSGDTIICWTGASVKLEVLWASNADIITRYLEGGSTPAAGECPSGRVYSKSHGFTLNNAKYLHIRPLLGDSYIGVKGSANLPLPGNLVSSIGKEGDAVRKVEAIERLEPPSVFDFALFSGTFIQ